MEASPPFLSQGSLIPSSPRAEIGHKLSVSRAKRNGKGRNESLANKDDLEVNIYLVVKEDSTHGNLQGPEACMMNIS